MSGRFARLLRLPLLLCLAGIPLLTSASTTTRRQSGVLWQLTYDAAGNVASSTDGNGSRTEYTWDVMKRLSRVRHADGATVEYTHDVLGRRVRMADALGATAYAYDIHDRLISQTDPFGRTTSYAYEPRGLLRQITYPDGSVVRYEWDRDGRLAVVADARGRTSYDYDAAGRVSRRVLPNGIATTWSWDATSRLQRLEHGVADRILLGLDYEYDAAGNQTRRTLREAGREPQVTEFRFGRGSRLTGVRYPDGEDVSLAYDEAGRPSLIESSSEGSTRLMYDATGRVQRVHRPGGTETFEYDGNGRLVRKVTAAGGAIQYEWNAAGRLRRIRASAEVTELFYDGDGNLLRESVAGRVTDFAYAGTGATASLIAESSAGGPLVIYPTGREPIGQRISGGAGEFYLHDGDGNVIAVASDAGELLRRIDHDAFGTVRGGTASGQLRFGPGGVPIGPASRHAPAWYEPQSMPRQVLSAIRRTTKISGAVTRILGDIPLDDEIAERSLRASLAKMPWDVTLEHPELRHGLVGAARSAYPMMSGLGRLLATMEGIAKGSDVLREGYGFGLAAVAGVAPIVASAVADAAGVAFDHGGWSRILSRPPLAIGPMSARVAIQAGVTRALFTNVHSMAVGFLLADAVLSAQIGLTLHAHERLRHQTVSTLSARGVDEARIREYLRQDGVPIDQQGRYLPFGDGGGCPGPGCGGGGPGEGVGSPGSALGGVSLDAVARVLGDVSDLVGATFDPASGQLILLGRRNVSLPPLNAEDLDVTIRSLERGEQPSMSIEPCRPGTQDGCMKVLYSGRFRHPDRSDVLWVRHSAAGPLEATTAPATFGTHFGWVIFESDRYLKMMSLGLDNLDPSRSFTTSVPGYSSMTARLAAGAAQRPLQDDDCLIPTPAHRHLPSNCHRMWFVAGEVGSDPDAPRELIVRRSADGLSLMFDPVVIETEARFSRFDQNGRMVNVPGNAPEIDAFVAHLNASYSGYAAEKRELAELVQLAKTVGLVRWMQDQNIRMDVRSTTLTRLSGVETPWTTRGVESTSGRIRIYGGVEFPAVNRYVLDNAPAALGRAALNARPSLATPSWDMTGTGGEPLAAVAFHLAERRVRGAHGASWSDALGPDLETAVHRTYSSASSGDGSFGPHWSLDDAHLTIRHLRNPDGTRRTRAFVTDRGRVSELALTTEGFFEPVAPGSGVDHMGITRDDPYTPLGSPELRFEAGPDIDVRNDAGQRVAFNGFALRRSDGETLHFNAAGEMVTRRRPSGEQTAYQREGARLSAITPSSGPGVRLHYDEQGRVTQLTSSAGGSISYGYDAEGRLASVTDAAGARLASYEYDANGRMTRELNREGRAIERVHDDLGRVLEMRMDAGHVTRFEYDDAARRITTHDARGGTTHRDHDERGRLVAMTDAAGATTTYRWSEDDRLLAVTDGLGATTSFEYTERGLLGGVVAADGTRTRVLEHDADGRPTIVVDAANQLTFTDYDGHGRPAVIRSGYRLDSVSPDGRIGYAPVDTITVAFAYDAAGRVTAVRDPGGYVTRLTYDDAARTARLASPGNRAVTLTWDERNRTIARSDGADEVRFEYDAEDRLRSATTAAGATTFGWTDFDLISVVNPAGDTVRLERDAASRLLAVTGPDGTATRADYDVAGNVVGLTDAGGDRIAYDYDALGRLVTVRRGDAPRMSSAGRQGSSSALPIAVGLVLVGGAAVLMLRQASAGRSGGRRGGRRRTGQGTGDSDSIF